MEVRLAEKPRVPPVGLYYAGPESSRDRAPQIHLHSGHAPWQSVIKQHDVRENGHVRNHLEGL